MKPWERYQQLSRRCKKNIAVGLSVGLALSGLAIPTPEMRSSAMKVEIPVSEPEPEEASVSMNVSSDMVEPESSSPPEAEKGDPVEERGIIGMDASGNVVRESRVVGEERNGSSTSNVSGETAAEQQNMQEALEVVEQEKDMEMLERLRTMSDLAEYEDDVKNPNLKLYVNSVENYGEAPNLALQADLFQYPVELGYSIDSNFNGKLMQPLPDLMELGMDEPEMQENEMAGATEETVDVSGKENEEQHTEDMQAEQTTGLLSSGTQGEEKQETETVQNVEEQTKNGNSGSEQPEYTREMKTSESGLEEVKEEKGFESGLDVGGEGELFESGLEKGSEENSSAFGQGETNMEQTLESEEIEGRVENSPASGQSEIDIEKADETVQEETDQESVESSADRALEQAEKLNLREFLNNIYSNIQSVVPVMREQWIEVKRQEHVDIDVQQGKDGGQESDTSIKQEKDAQETDLERLQNADDPGNDLNSLPDAGDQENDSRQQEEMTESEEEILQDSQAVCRILVKGLSRSQSDVYVGDIELIPSGDNGFDKIRLDTDMDYADSVVLREDAASGEVKVWVTDGEEELGTVFSYMRDTVNPEISLDGEAYQTLVTEKGEIYCTNSPDIRFSVQDGEQSAGIDHAVLIYGDRFGFVIDGMDAPQYHLPESFFGNVNYSCQDQAGNVSEAKSQYFLIEKEAPTIDITEGERYTAPYTMGISVQDCGEIISGIQSIECTVNGKPYELKNVTTTEYVSLAEGLRAPAKQAFSLNFGETGHYDVSIRVSDYCGNAVMLHKEMDVTEEELVAVFLAKEFKIYVDPERIFGREQVFSEGLALKNISNVDTKVTISEIDVDVKSETLENGVSKDCQLYLIAPDTGERIPLQNGSNENVYSFLMSAENAGTLADLDFVGELSDGSEAYWKQDDISINLKFLFKKCEE